MGYQETSLETTNFGITITGESCFAGCINLKQFILERRTYMISKKIFNCKSIGYADYNNRPGKVCMDNNKFGIDLPYITDFQHSAFQDCSSLECIKLYGN